MTMELYHKFGGMTWPLPGHDMDEQLEWRMRYAEKFRVEHQAVADRYDAASIIAAYSELVQCTAKKRGHVIAELRNAQNQK